jgi:hypothetical protein
MPLSTVELVQAGYVPASEQIGYSQTWHHRGVAGPGELAVHWGLRPR